MAMNLQQTPAPGESMVRYKGDVVEFRVTASAPVGGQAWLRTNLGNAAIARREIIRHVEQAEPVLARDWHDIALPRVDDRTFALRVPLLETGQFAAKAFLSTTEDALPIWPAGGNTLLKVEPAGACCSNTIYTAFVRQFGPGRQDGPAHAAAVAELDAAGYDVIPRSGKFRDLVKELDFILVRLRCRIIQLLPIHPTPTTYARMGRFGSPFAALDFFDIDPALAEFDRQTTPLDQFIELVDAVHARHGKLLLDLPINHTGWASKLQVHHPKWFARNDDRTFISPGAWGVTWQDLSKLDYRQRELWRYMAGVFFYWCGKGVDGFRCDAGYMVPLPVWKYIVAKVRQSFPDTTFILEGLGGSFEITQTLLSEANLDWAYSELFQNYDRTQIEGYLPGCIATAQTRGLLVHYAETHDNNRLATRSKLHARLRVALCALLSQDGAFGITAGVEWYATEDVDVHGAASLNWNSADNMIDHLARLHAILEGHPCFHPGAQARIIPSGTGNTVALLRRSGDGGRRLLILANLDEQTGVTVRWKREAFDAGADTRDLVSGRLVSPETEQAACRLALAPGEIVCLSGRPADLDELAAVTAHRDCCPARIRIQRLRAMALQAWNLRRGAAPPDDVDALAESLAGDPLVFCGAIEPEGAATPAYEPRPRVTRWRWPRDCRRTLLLPEDDFLLIECPHPFAVRVLDAATVLRSDAALPRADGAYFALLLPFDEPVGNVGLTLDLSVHEPGKTQHNTAPVMKLRGFDTAPQTRFDNEELRRQDRVALCTNGRGAMAQVRCRWSELVSQYDALLAANLHPDHPVDRQVVLTRCRAWLEYRGYSQAFGIDCQREFRMDPDGSPVWSFEVPYGVGRHALIDIRLTMEQGANRIMLRFERLANSVHGELHEEDDAVRIVVRPDLEDRNFHATTMAQDGPATRWPAAIDPGPSGFRFRLSEGQALFVSASAGAFTPQPEWLYSVALPFEIDRALAGKTDLFSPGYFAFRLKCGEQACLDAAAGETAPQQTGAAGPCHDPRTLPITETMLRSMRQFIVKRDDSLTVIAGYPWFLDWGRDTLICLRGMIAAGLLDETREILRQFARFESGGTLPNMIRGNDNSNRDTSDAPLWFFTACADFIRRSASEDLLRMDCGGRALSEVLRSMADGYRAGTANGIKMDGASGLIFSPTHFTWMDTNHPAGTPREGYPIEIQALWHAALQLMARLEPGGDWGELARQVCASIAELFWLEQAGGLADCLHGAPGRAARQCTRDDAVRPNQLLAITLGAIDDKRMAASILRACEELLVPGALRSLADRPVQYPLPVYRDDRLINDPVNPYWGHYTGDEDTRRKPAYHNGTAWTWIFPSYCEALCMVHGPAALAAARAILASGVDLINRGCIGHLPEIVDGSHPHALRGCGAQAWSATEFQRVATYLDVRLS